MGFLKWELYDETAVVTMERPPANAISAELLTELDELLTKFEENRQVKVIVLRGEGRFFSAGADIKQFTAITDEAKSIEMAKQGHRIFNKIEQFPKPVIASIHGAALGGGLELAMSCHIRIVSESAKLGLPEITLGIIPGYAGTQRLPQYVGIEKAAEMMLTGEPITGAEAANVGLALKAVSEKQLFDETMKLAKKIQSKSPASIRAILHLLKYAKSSKFAEGAEEEIKQFSEVFQTEDAKEGINAFLEKRQPKFTGK